MKQGSRVRLQMMSSETKDRADRHNDVRGTLLTDLVVGERLKIYPEREGDNPKGIATSLVKEISSSDDGATMIQTEFSLYKLVELDESGAV